MQEQDQDEDQERQSWRQSLPSGSAAPKKTKIPARLSPGRDQSWGWEFAMLSFPGRHLAPKGLPASRRYSPRQAELRPHSRAVQRLTVAGFRVRPLSSLGLAFAAPACEPDKDTFVTLAPRLYHLTPGRPPLVAVRWPGVTGLTSYLSGCIWLTSQRCFFTSPAFGSDGPLPRPISFPVRMLTLSRLSASFIWRLG